MVRWRLVLVVVGGLLAAAAGTVLAVAVNVATGGSANWFPPVERYPLWWSAGATAAVAGAGLLVWWAKRQYERGAADLVPAVQRLEGWVVGRPEKVNQISAALRRGGTVGITTAVDGAGGFGKTTIAKMVRADPRILHHFGGRIYWVTVGRDNRGQVLVRLVNDLITQIQPSHPGTFTSVQQAADHLGALLNVGPPRLLILDDVWTEEQLASFPVAGQCARLVTTRNSSLHANIGVKVDQMSEAQARAVLLDNLQQSLPSSIADGLVSETGRWPLLLRLVNNMLADASRVHTDITPVADDLLGKIRQAGALHLDRLAGAAIGQLDVNDPEQRRKTIRATIEASTGLLPAADRRRLVELGVFAEDETIPVSLVGALWRETGDLDQRTAETIYARLADLALVTLTPTGDGGVIELHDVIRDFLCKELGPTRLKQLHQLLLNGLVKNLPRSPVTASGDNSGTYARRHMAAHAAACGSLDSLVNDPAFLLAADPGSILAQHGNVRTTEARRALAAFDLTMSGWGSSDDTRRMARLAANAARVHASELVAACARQPVQDWQIRWAAWTGQVYRKLTGHNDTVHAVALGQAAGRDVIVSGSADATVRIWDEVTGDLVHTMTGHTDSVLAVAIGQAAGRDVVASGSDDETVRIWDAVTGNPVRTMTGHYGEVTALAAGRVGERDVIVSGSRDTTIRIWDTVTGDPVRTMTSHDTIRAVAFGRAADRDVIVSGSLGLTVKMWDPVTGNPVRTVQADYEYPDGTALAAMFGRAGERDVIVFGCYNGTVRIVNAVTGELILMHADAVTALATGRAGERDVLISGSEDAIVRIWDLGQLTEPSLPGREDDNLAGHHDAVTAVAIGRAGERDVIVSGSYDKTVRIWDAVTGNPVGTPLVGHDDAVTAVAIGRAGERDVLISGSDDATVRIWDAVTGKPLGTPIRHYREKVAVAIGRAGDRDVIVSGSYDKTVRIWDAVTGGPVRRPIKTGLRGILAVAIGRAGNRDVIISGSLDVLVRIWDAVTGDPVGTPLNGHSGAVTAVAIGRAGDRDVIVSGSGDTTVRIWDAVTGDPVGTPLIGHDDAVTAVALRHIGDLDVIASGSQDRAVFMYEHHPYVQYL